MTARAEDPRKSRGWRPPTRRVFVQMLAAAAAAIVLDDRAKPPPALWIGHF